MQSDPIDPSSSPMPSHHHVPNSAREIKPIENQVRVIECLSGTRAQNAVVHLTFARIGRQYYFALGLVCAFAATSERRPRQV